ncbi:NADPH-dependent FMN reductase [Polychytrium aggregatum]|uniref:NADPH-dependent FMN reductase n=1 Tax=Polychytrium aggregatum TaxID=110093 RepID=UPI0022FDEE60|nr:NADPH-dependent FMN reductase [Polychytrium aggregatum]KAI9201887.1 NADPH-dependent FMN reductase [Polychytrium aggregatum]
MSKLTISVIYGSVRPGRMGIRLAKYIQQQLISRGHDSHLIDPLETPVPLFTGRHSWMKPGENPILDKLADTLRRSDAFVIVSAEYNHTIPPALTNLMDYFFDEYKYKPSAIATYSMGSFGGVRAAMALRPFLGELGTVSIPTLFPVPTIQDAFTPEGHPVDKVYHERFDRFCKELEWYAHSLKASREAGVP